jgi:hypothetical protein
VRRPCASNASGRVPLCSGAFAPRAGILEAKPGSTFGSVTSPGLMAYCIGILQSLVQ